MFDRGLRRRAAGGDATTALAELGERLDERDAGGQQVQRRRACWRARPTTSTPTRSRGRRPWRAGRSSHQAIQLLLNWRGEPTPADLVDEALARLADEERSIGDWIAALGPADEADLRGRAVERVTQFVECFPPLAGRWHPMTEAPVQWPVDGPILLRAKVDLVIGRPAGAESRKVLDRPQVGPHRRPPPRGPALLRPRRDAGREVPPRSVASFSLEAGEAVVEEVERGACCGRRCAARSTPSTG